MGFDTPIGDTEACFELGPRESVAVADVDLVQSLVADGAQVTGQSRRQQVARLNGPGQRRGVEGVGSGEFAREGQTFSQGARLATTEVGESPVANRAAGHAAGVGVTLTVSHEQQSCSRGGRTALAHPGVGQ